MAISQVQPLLRAVRMSRSRYLYGLEQTPDDRLRWSPGGEAATPLQLAGKVGMYCSFMAHLIRERNRPERPGEMPPPPPDRHAARSALEAAFTQLEAAIESVAEADLEQSVPAPWGETSLRELLTWIPGMLGYCQGQLNYLQTAYGDTNPNIPPDWGHE